MRGFAWELNKILFKRRGLLLILLFFGIKLATLAFGTANVNALIEQNRDVYLSYVQKVTGPLTAEKQRKIEADHQAITDAQAKSAAIDSDFMSGKITEGEYSAQIAQVQVILKKADGFQIFYDQYQYVLQNTDRRYFLYTNGWKALLSSDALDVVLVLLVLVLAVPVFTQEYELDMAPLLLSSARGRGRLAVQKIAAAVLLSAVASLLFSAGSYGYYAIRYGLPAGSAPLQSVPFFSGSAYNLSLFQAFLFVCAIKAAGYALFAVMVLLLGALCKRTLPALFAGLGLAVLPWLLFLSGSLKYRLPLPLGFMLANGYLRGTTAEQTLNGVVTPAFTAVSLPAFCVAASVLLLLFLCCGAGTALRYTGWRKRGRTA